MRVELGREIGRDDIASLDADAVVLATGALPLEIEVPGAADSEIEVAMPHDVVREGRPDAPVAVVWDHAGGVIGLGPTEALIEQGCQVQAVMPGFAVAEDINLIQRVPLYHRLLEAGTTFTPNCEVTRLEGDDVVLRSVHSFDESRVGPVDLLVAWCGSRAVDELRTAIEAAGIELHLAGDCLAPRLAEIAVAEGALAGRSI